MLLAVWQNEALKGTSKWIVEYQNRDGLHITVVPSRQDIAKFGNLPHFSMF